MIWYLFIIFMLLIGFFLVIGYSTRTRLWVQLGALFLILVGLFILSTGLSYPAGFVVGF